MDIARILSRYWPEAQWSLSGNDYERLRWHGPGEKPSLADIEAKADAMALEDARQSALDRIRDSYNAAVAPVVTPYPNYERETWYRQEQEARAYQADDTAPCPLLSRIANERGLTLDDLASRVLANVAAYEQIAGDATGIRQRLEGEIEAAYAAGDVEALQAIDWP